MDGRIPPPVPTAVSREVAAMLRIIGRGAAGSRGLEPDQARWLMQRLLRRELADVQLGAVLLSLRMKGETAAELLGFVQAVEETLPRLRVNRPVVVTASVNGARRLPNQVPLLAMLLRRRGIATLVIGQEQRDARLHTAALWTALHLPRAQGLGDAEALLQAGEAVYIDLRRLGPELADLTDLREVLGVRNVAHTLVKLLAPIAGPSLLLSGHTHGEYGPLMRDVLAARRCTALVLRGCEGEAVPHPSRATPLLWAHPPGGLAGPAELPRIGDADEVPPQAGLDLDASCAWTLEVADGRRPAPAALDRFVDVVRDAMQTIDGRARTSR